MIRSMVAGESATGSTEGITQSPCRVTADFLRYPYRNLTGLWKADTTLRHRRGNSFGKKLSGFLTERKAFICLALFCVQMGGEGLILVTNNPLVSARFSSRDDVRWVAGGYGEVLCAVRDLVHGGHALLTHPLAGSVKPNETPFRSVALEGTVGALDFPSLALIEEGLALWRRTPPRPGLGEDASLSFRDDFAEIDLSLLELLEEKE